MKVELTCGKCLKLYKIQPYRLGKSRYCGAVCRNSVGGIAGGRAGKGVSRNKGNKRPDLSAYNHLHPKRGPESKNWKGDSVGYHALHVWVRKTYGSPTSCENCGGKSKKVGTLRKVSNIQWANISKKYTRKREDWMALCSKCHYKFDHILYGNPAPFLVGW